MGGGGEGRGFHRDLNSRALACESGVLTIISPSYLQNGAAVMFASSSPYFTQRLESFSSIILSVIV